MGLEVALVDAAQGVFTVRGKQWAVGPRYTLLEHIGAGSYGDVCKAVDNDTQEIVALKRIPDVLCCPMLAKRVLREVCIMRRLSHPYIIKLSDVFTRRSSDVEEGIDLFLATEYADGGDVYRLRKPLTAHEVKMLIWQLLVGIRYIHSCHVWHRDIKSENTLLSANMVVKICDFGLARSALGQGPPETQLPREVLLQGSSSGAKKKSLVRQYTRTVVTPSYRAPEVVMSRGQYTSAIDIWSIGCIFWEILQRQMNPTRLGPPAKPLFGVRGEPATPECGDAYVKNGETPLAEQLDVIFNVVGTPTWQDIESVPSEAWRTYLKRLPGRSGNLLYSMTGCDREAVDLLVRMLAFDPARRCTADEALAHIFFKGLKKPLDLTPVPLPSEELQVQLPDAEFWRINDPAVALGLLERELEQSAYEPDGGRRKLEWLLEREAEGQQLLHMLRLPRAVPMPVTPYQGEAPSGVSSLQDFLVTPPGESVGGEGSFLPTLSLRAGGESSQSGMMSSASSVDKGGHLGGLTLGGGVLLGLDGPSTRVLRTASGGMGSGNRSSTEAGQMLPPRTTLARQGSLRLSSEAGASDVAIEVRDLQPGQTLLVKQGSTSLPDLNGLVRVNSVPPMPVVALGGDTGPPGARRGKQAGGAARGGQLRPAVGARRAQQEAPGVEIGELGDEGGLVLRRSPRLRDIKPDELPHRKRFCMRA